MFHESERERERESVCVCMCVCMCVCVCVCVCSECLSNKGGSLPQEVKMCKVNKLISTDLQLSAAGNVSFGFQKQPERKGITFWDEYVFAIVC